MSASELQLRKCSAIIMMAVLPKNEAEQLFYANGRGAGLIDCLILVVRLFIIPSRFPRLLVDLITT